MTLPNGNVHEMEITNGSLNFDCKAGPSWNPFSPYDPATVVTNDEVDADVGFGLGDDGGGDDNGGDDSDDDGNVMWRIIWL